MVLWWLGWWQDVVLFVEEEISSRDRGHRKEDMDAIDFTGATRPMVLEFVPRKYPMHTLRRMATVPATTVRQRAVVLCPLEQQLCGLTKGSLGRAVEGGGWV